MNWKCFLLNFASSLTFKLFSTLISLPLIFLVIGISFTQNESLNRLEQQEDKRKKDGKRKAMRQTHIVKVTEMFLTQTKSACYSDQEIFIGWLQLSKNEIVLNKF